PDPQPEDDSEDRCQKSPTECRCNALLYVFGGYIVGLLMVLIWYYRNPQEACKDLNTKWIFIVLLALLLIILVRPRASSLKTYKSFFNDNIQWSQMVIRDIFQHHINVQDVKEELEAQRYKIHLVNLWLNLIIFILLIIIIYQSVCFWFRYLSNDNYENFYITEAFEDYDDQYHQIMGLRALPLSNCEDNRYVKVSSEFTPAYTKIVINCGGKIGDMLRDLVQAFEPKTCKMNTQRCLPTPGYPKYLRYVWILLLYLLAWFLVFWEPYGLRQRHCVMTYFYPEESRRRSHDLHDIILKNRSEKTFM
ncbi:GD13616, partial [Drosophila simulans]